MPRNDALASRALGSCLVSCFSKKDGVLLRGWTVELWWLIFVVNLTAYGIKTKVAEGRSRKGFLDLI